MRWLLSVVVVLAALPRPAWPCSSAPTRATTLVRASDLIVRVRATGYAQAPRAVPPIGEPSALVQFVVLEVLRGADAPVGLQLPGTLTDQDDFNDRSAPYDFVRRGGRRGNCFATEYRNGGEFLLFLKKRGDAPGSGYTTQWAALSAVNEQLRADRDPWLAWVRQAVKGAAPVASRKG